MNKTECKKCNRFITNNNFKRHNETCDGTYFEGPHKSWIKKSKEEIYQNKVENLKKARKSLRTKPVWNKGLDKNDSRVKKYAESIRKAHSEGRIDRSYLDDPEYKLKQRQNAKSQGFGGYRENAGRSKKFYYNDSFGKKVCLQSTYELKCAEILDDLEIKWIRPTYIKYNGNKKYFPDFYLVDYNIYLDPKNNFLAKKDHEKISCVCDQNNVKVLILTEDNLTKEFIKNATESER